MNSKFYFILDLHSAQSQISIPVLKGDTAREWHISFSDGGREYFIKDGVLAKLEIKRPDGTFINAFCPIENNATAVYKFEQNGNTAAREGLHECNVVLYENDRVLASPRFSMVVSGRAIDSDDINLTDDDLTVIDAIVKAEAARQVSETARVNAEAARAVAEDNREAAEEARVSESAEAIQRVDSKITEIDRMAAEGDFDGADGFSPTINVEPTAYGYKITITDKNGTKSYEIYHGADGDNGSDGSVAEYSLYSDLNHTDYVLTIGLKDDKGRVVSTSTVDFPLESVVVGGDEKDGIITLTLVNGNTISFDIGDLVNGLVSQADFEAVMGSYVNDIANLIGGEAL